MAEPRIHLKKEGDGEVEVFMSFGLQDQCAQLIGSAENIARVTEIQGLVMALVTCALVPRTTFGRPTVDVESFDPPGISPEEIERLLDWVLEHTLDFFVRQLNSRSKLALSKKETLKEINSSLISIADEVSKT
ncbi:MULTISPECIES: hypothetical protein [unclassified Beijerinckia]|uniref:hypothetical protein n=1 Tax=unclassified Beijerinckia TaxID=2638183 RepID=UPI00089904A5|nr:MULTISPECIES: hypothetical protein [unclassified Beijerinckia]MDH7796433.1 hypothetical protein [Beijerinckia sp. GAS462]SEC44864.1 hypothetical protein SAMN05443249_2715 [Beijerinckia sp. 28-YEA-48]